MSVLSTARSAAGDTRGPISRHAALVAAGQARDAADLRVLLDMLGLIGAVNSSHGRTRMYSHYGCRCRACREANTAAMRVCRARKYLKARRGEPPAAEFAARLPAGMPIAALPGVDGRVINPLHAAGIITAGDLAARSDADLCAVPGIGACRIAVLVRAIQAQLDRMEDDR